MEKTTNYTARQLTAMWRDGDEIEAEDVRPDGCGIVDESWYIARLPDGRWAAWSDAALDQDPRFYDTEQEARDDWAEAEEAELQTRPDDDAEKLIRENVEVSDLADYLTAPSGHCLGVYADGTVSVGDSVGSEIDQDERPIATVRCPGIGNVDMTGWREGWECEGLSDEAVIRDCCENGDVEGDLKDLTRKLVENARECCEEEAATDA